jgi:predicted metal-dependent hydrolase
MTLKLEFVKADGFVAEVIRTRRRKTASVQVREGKVSVVVPRNLSDTRIHEIVTKKTRWIREKLHLHRQSVPVKPKEYVSGESFTYLGRNYRLKVENSAERSVRLTNGRLTVSLHSKSTSPQSVRDALTDWYRTRAEQKLHEKVERYAKVIGVQPASVEVKTFKSRWGSCHSDGRIKFNWKIIVAPNHIVDYVVIHELCHCITTTTAQRSGSALNVCSLTTPSPGNG